MSEFYFAWVGSAIETTMKNWDWHSKPLNILAAMPYARSYKQFVDKTGFKARATILDSGAFSAYASGAPTDIDALICEARTVAWNEVVALDVIGDSAASRENALAMRAAGLEVMPVFHYGEPWELLSEYCSKFHRVGISCRFGEPKGDALRWVDQCFAREWPKLFHSFGWVSREVLLAVPFDSADSGAWTSSLRFGIWHGYGRRNLGYRVKAKDHDARVDVQHFWGLQEELRGTWGAMLREPRAAKERENESK